MNDAPKKQAKCWLTGTTFEIGDIVTRGGDDRQRIIDVNDAGDLIEVECIKEPLGSLNEDGTRGEPWCKLGDRESNLTRRYSHPEPQEIEPANFDNHSRWQELNQALIAEAVKSLGTGPISYGVTPLTAFQASMQAFMRSLSEYMQAEVNAHIARQAIMEEDARWREIAALCQPNGGDA